MGVEVSQESRAVRDVTGSWFPVTFEIYDKSWQQDKGSAYQLHVRKCRSFFFDIITTFNPFASEVYT